ncbi:exported hypothetical protein [Methylacidiphilum fumariolicum SolV]|uniref:Uncharacterized protein n=2 Tax=Candidatus Methylacidiphilum fumarolicum TaxID=591154 RepID=I0JYF7_METFB|nr:conserved protein of unknown function [Candidatus Methylacidiphilum fumarolicum]CCG92276.1 exported hypothetical protein [Methylacidiphilum fumariolicum SolV]
MNAVRNLLAYGLAALSVFTASSSECEAWEEEDFDRRRKIAVKRPR